MKGKKAPTLNHRIRSDIEGRILSGEWEPGFRIPFEHELMEQYGCSRMTVNKVLSALAESGMIERRRRAGSFVARRSPEQELVTLEIPDIGLALGSRQRRYAYRLLSKQARKADPGIYSETALAGDGELIAIDGVHLADDRVVGVEHRLLNAASVPEVLQVDFTLTSPGTWLLQEVSWTRGEYRITAEGASEQDATVLECAPGQACLVIERRTWRGEAPITWARQIFLSSEHELVARFTTGGR